MLLVLTIAGSGVDLVELQSRYDAGQIPADHLRPLMEVWERHEAALKVFEEDLNRSLPS